MPSKAKPKPQLPPPEEYNRFVEGLELRRVRLVEATVRSLEPMPNPTASEVELEEQYSFTPMDNGFEAVGKFRLRILEGETRAEQGTVEVSFGFWYSSLVKPEASQFLGHFEVFREINLPINMWPFAREYIHNSMARMDWPPFTLPLRKVGPRGPKNAKAKSGSRA
jgi:hypothetical protein